MIEFVPGAIPPQRGRREKDVRYERSAPGRQRARTFRQTPLGRAAQRRSDDHKYLTREFVAWDGEGLNIDGTHKYVLLQNSCGDVLRNLNGIPSGEIFELLLHARREYADAIHVLFGAGYDWNNWLRSFDRESVERVYRKTSRWGTQVGGWILDWRPGKHFRVKRDKLSITTYDVLPFFQRPFVQACDEYLGDRFVSRDLIVRNKDRRSDFTPADLAEIEVYNTAELENLVLLMWELRDRLDRVGLRPQRWDGPGAIATALLAREGIANARPTGTAPEIRRATRHAYAGGRFELVRWGDVDAPAYEYDVNSAYPNALRFVPCLAHGKWIRHDGDPGEREFALYHVRYRGPQNANPGPLFRRHDRGQINYPGKVIGWYWSPEIRVARKYAETVKGASLTVTECWEWQADPEGCKQAGHSPHPFDFIPAYYDRRKALKAAGDGAHVGLKLALNSLYGKLAQQVGAYPCPQGICKKCHPDFPGWHLPPYHTLEYAGFTTSFTRAQVLEAAMLDLDAVIAFETDALFTMRPLPLQLGSGLGQWEATEFRSLSYCQSGTYFATGADGKEIVRTRGVDRGKLTRAQFREALAQPAAADQKMHSQLTRFMGAGISLAQSWDDWCTWKVTPKELWAGPPEDSKRHHLGGCRLCYTPRELRKDPTLGIKPGVWHETECWYDDGGFPHSAQYPVMWEPDSYPHLMPELEELRMAAYEAWDGNE